nr:ankyrin repeat-containing protein At5g02620-like [Ipomoea batatas]
MAAPSPALPCERPYFSRSLPLYRAIVAANWEEAEIFFNQNPSAIQSPLNYNLDTSLHVAAKAGNASFAEKLVAVMPDEGLRRKDVCGQTPLHVAAWHGNVEVAEILVRRDYNLLYVHTQDGLFPIHFAARNHRKSKEAFLYFFRLTKDDEYGQPNPYECGPIGVSILVNLIGSKFYDLALELIKMYPDLGRHNGLCSNMSALDTIVRFDCPIINKHNLSL